MKGSVFAWLVAIVLGVAAPVAVPVAAAQSELPTVMREREILSERPSGFWTSNKPATGGAYRWRLLLLGTGIALTTGFVMLRLVRRTNAKRAVTATPAVTVQASAAPRTDHR